eukprot:5139888-Prymnesium_polylepis.1
MEAPATRGTTGCMSCASMGVERAETVDKCFPRRIRRPLGHGVIVLCGSGGTWKELRGGYMV